MIARTQEGRQAGEDGRHAGGRRETVGRTLHPADLGDQLVGIRVAVARIDEPLGFAGEGVAHLFGRGEGEARGQVQGYAVLAIGRAFGLLPDSRGFELRIFHQADFSEEGKIS